MRSRLTSQQSYVMLYIAWNNVLHNFQQLCFDIRRYFVRKIFIALYRGFSPTFVSQFCIQNGDIYIYIFIPEIYT